ncbi:hypothetical protein J6590_059844, partial [Homalodisca vitripennis]
QETLSNASPGYKRFKGDLRTTTYGWVGGQLTRTSSLSVTHPSSSHDRHCLIRLSCDNICTRYNTPLATGEIIQRESMPDH